MKNTARILVTLLTVLAICGTTPTLARADLQNQCGTDYCVATPTPCDQGGGVLWDQNYVLLLSDSIDIGDPLDAYIYYKDKLLDLNFHSKENGFYIWGISTKWAYVHPGWDDSSNWTIYFHTAIPPQ